MDRLKIYDDIDKLCQGFTNFLSNQIIKRPFTICLSGGSTPKNLFDFWAKEYSKDIPWSNIKFFWGDERCVPPDHPDSNYGMTKSYLFDHIDIPKENIFRIKGEEDPDNETLRYASILDDEISHDHSLPQFDLVILGLGDDGHTASIFPHEIDLWQSKSNCVKAIHPESGQQRISITGKIINNAKSVAFLVTGKKKARIVKNVAIRKNIFKDKLPAALVDPLSGNLLWFLDDEAASEL